MEEKLEKELKTLVLKMKDENTALFKILSKLNPEKEETLAVQEESKHKSLKNEKSIKTKN